MAEYYNLDIFLVFFVLVFLLLLNLYLFAKYRNIGFVLILITFIFSMVLAVESMKISDFPLTPFLQIFFILFNAILFIITCFDIFSNEKKKGRLYE